MPHPPQQTSFLLHSHSKENEEKKRNVADGVRPIALGEIDLICLH